MKTKIFVLLPVMLLLLAFQARAATDTWEKAVSLTPTSNTDFASDGFKQSLQNAKAANANTASFIITYYTSNCQSSNVDSGWNTPTPDSLSAGAAYARSLGMRVEFIPHLEAYDTWGGLCTWRASIAPQDRTTFFANYLSMLKNLATFGPDELVVGAELISVSSAKINPDNTTQWNKIISSLRASYPQIKLTYSANWGSGDFATETNQIQFWNNLDSIGISGYYELPSSTTATTDIESQWDHWNQSNIAPLSNQYHKPVQFTEIGYESANGARYQPWDYNRKWWAGYNGDEQANLYTAMFDYWGKQSSFSGVNLWDWETNPNAGGVGNTDYTPQNKPAQAVIAKYFAGGAVPGPTPTPTPTPPPSNGNFSSSATTTPASPIVNQNLTANASVKSNTASSNLLVDVEIYHSGNKVAQQFFDNESFTASQTKTYSVNYTPNTTGDYSISVGVFSSGWATNYDWNANAGLFKVGSNTPPTPTPTPTPPPSTGALDIWWPSDGATVQGVQPFKGMVEGLDLSQYQMYWQVDGDVLNQMSDSPADYPHKESLVDLTNWSWKSDNNYGINFVAKNLSTNIIGQKMITIHVTH